MNLLAAVWMLTVLNQPFWAGVAQATGGWDPARAAWWWTIPVFALVWVWFSLELLTWGRAAPPVLAALLVVSAAVAYFLRRDGTVFDRETFARIVETDWAQARGLFSVPLAAWVVGLGVAPAVLLWSWPRVPRGFADELLDKSLVVAALLAVGVAILFFHMAAYATLFRHHRELRLQFVPTNVLSAAHGYAKARWRPQRETERIPAGTGRLPGRVCQGHAMDCCRTDRMVQAHDRAAGTSDSMPPHDLAPAVPGPAGTRAASDRPRPDRFALRHGAPAARAPS